MQADLTHRIEGASGHAVRPICNATGRIFAAPVTATPTCPECREVEARRRGEFDRDKTAVRSALQAATECTGDGPLVEHRNEAGHVILACCDPTCAWCDGRLDCDEHGEFKVQRWRKLSEPLKPDFTTWLGFGRELRVLGRTVVLLAKMRALAWLKHRRAHLELEAPR